MMRMYDVKKEISFNNVGRGMARLLMLMSQPEKAKAFYAEDLHFEGGDVKSLHWYNIIEPTGNVKEVDISEEVGTDEPFKVFAKEWRVTKHFIDLCERLAEERD